MEPAGLVAAVVRWRRWARDRRVLVAAGAALVVAAIAVSWLTARAAIRRQHPVLTVQAPASAPVGAPIELLVLARDADGRPLAATIDADCDGGRVWGEGATPTRALGPVTAGADGQARLVVPTGLGLADDTLTVSIWPVGAKRAAVTATVRRRTDERRARVATDRPLYRPGDDVRGRAVVLERHALTPVADAAVEWELVAPDGTIAARGQAVTNEGVAHWVTRLADHAPGGDWRLRCRGARTPVTECRVAVREFRAPLLRTVLTPDRESYGPGATGTVRCTVARATGGVPVGARCEVAIVVDGSVVQNLQESVPEDGALTFGFQLPAKISEGRAAASVTVHDGGAVETATVRVPVALGRLDVAFFPEGGDCVHGVPTRCYFSVRDPSGAPAHCVAELRDEKGARAAELRVTDAGMGVFEWTPRTGTRYRLVAVEPAGVRLRGEVPPVVQGGVVLRALEACTPPGAPIPLELTATRGGTYRVVAAVRGAQIAQSVVTLAAGVPARCEVPRCSDAGGVARVTVLDARSVPRAERLVALAPARSLAVEVATSRAAVAPGAPLGVTITTRDEGGRPVPATVGVTVCDEALHALAADRDTPGLPLHFLLGLEVEELRDAARLGAGPEAARAADLLLGVQGWRRFAWRNPAALAAAHGDAAARVAPAALDEALVVVASDRRAARAMGAALASLDGTMRTMLAWLVALCGAGLAAWWWRRAELRDGPWRVAIACGGALVALAAVAWAVDAWPVFVVAALVLGATLAMGLLSAPVRRPSVRETTTVGAAVLLGGLPPLLLAHALMGAGSDSRAGRVRVTMDVASAEEDPFEEAIAPDGADLDREIATDEPVIDDPVIKDAEEMDHNETDDNEEYEQALGDEDALADRPLHGRFWNARIGVGGGAGGAFGARFGGQRNVVAHGGGAGPPADGEVLVRERAGRPFDVPATVRSTFADVLCWSPLVQTGPDGRASLAFHARDGCGTFRIAVDAHDERGALGDGMGQVVVRVPLQVAPKLPPEIGGGDRLDLPVVVANDTGGAVTASVNGEVAGGLQAPDGLSRLLALAAGARGRVLLPLVAAPGGGEASITLAAAAGEEAVDAVRLPLAIRAAGFPVTIARSGVAIGRAVVPITLPPDLDPRVLEGNLRCHLSPLADIEDGLDAMLAEPHGCFEQASSTTYPNVMVLQYLRRLGTASPATEQRARTLLAQGYGLLRGYQCPSGGFEWWGHEPAHAALTAYGLVEFTDMAEVFEVDPTIARRATEWLLSRRDGAGGFQPDGRSLDRVGGDGLARQAYICWALVAAGASSRIGTELDALAKAATDTSDPYVRALTALALHGAGRPAEAWRAKLAAAQGDTGAFHGATTSITGSRGENLLVESTALAALALLGDPAHHAAAARAVHWIRGQRRALGGYGATQATVLVLRALIAVDGAPDRAAEGEVRIGVNGAVVSAQRVTADRGAVVFGPEVLTALRSGENEITLEAPAGWRLPWALGLRWTATTPPSAPAAPVQLTVALDRERATEGSSVVCTVTLHNATAAAVGSPLARIGLPAGLTPQVEQLRALMAEETIAHFELGPREVVLYWRALEPGEVRVVRWDCTAEYPGRFQSPPSRAYPYYDDDRVTWAPPCSLHVDAAR